MTERGGLMTREQILSAFPPGRETTPVINKTGETIKVAYRVSRDPTGLILYAVPEAEWLKREEQQENQAVV